MPDIGTLPTEPRKAASAHIGRLPTGSRLQKKTSLEIRVSIY